MNQYNSTQSHINRCKSININMNNYKSTSTNLFDWLPIGSLLTIRPPCAASNAKAVESQAQALTETAMEHEQCQWTRPELVGWVWALSCFCG